MNHDQVRALAAVVDEETVEGGAFLLGVTPSAVSQRIRALESRLGQVLIRRTNPISVTEAGAAVLKYAREIELLESEAMDRLRGLAVDSSVPGQGPSGAGARPEPTVLRIGVNADSMATWFRPVFAEVAGWDDIVIRIEVADQDKALSLLTSGEVLGTITSASRTGYGTRVGKLGTMRYTAVATRELAEKYRVAEVDDRERPFVEVDLSSMPMVNFGKDDDLQFGLLRRAEISPVPPVSVVPSSVEFAFAVSAGLGWGFIPDMQLTDLDADLVPIAANPSVEVPLYWHHWTLASEKLGRLTEALQRAAERMH